MKRASVAVLKLGALYFGNKYRTSKNKSIKKTKKNIKNKIEKEASNYLFKNNNTKEDFNNLNKKLRNNKSFILSALKNDYKVWLYIDDNMKDDIKFVIEALKINPQIWNLIKEEDQKELLQIIIFKTFFKNNDELQKIIKKKKGLFTSFLY